MPAPFSADVLCAHSPSAHARLPMLRLLCSSLHPNACGVAGCRLPCKWISASSSLRELYACTLCCCIWVSCCTASCVTASVASQWMLHVPARLRPPPSGNGSQGSLCSCRTFPRPAVPSCMTHLSALTCPRRAHRAGICRSASVAYACRCRSQASPCFPAAASFSSVFALCFASSFGQGCSRQLPGFP